MAPNIKHLKQGNHYPDPVHTGKIQGSGVWADAANEVKITQTPNSTPSKNDFDSPRGWAPINKAAVPNTYTKQGGSKRD